MLWANGCVEEWAEKYRLSESEVRQCVERHGAEAETLLEKVQPYLNFKEGDRLWLAEAEFAIECTMCMCIKRFFICDDLRCFWHIKTMGFRCWIRLETFC